MPRIGRKNLDTSFFHIIVQGINKEYIFYKEDYIKKYIKLLFDNSKKYEIRIVAYCIMNNHAHMLLYTESIEDMSGYMKSVNTSYAKYYNRNENRVGIVFRNRYKSEPIFDEEYLLNCISYIHNNPVKAKIVRELNEYKYSSYNDYIYKRGIATTKTIKLVFGSIIDYIKTYKSIHIKDCEFADYIEDIDYRAKYEELKESNIGEIVLNKEELKNTVRKLVVEEKMPINKVSELLKISRFKISRIIRGKWCTRFTSPMCTQCA